MNHRCKFIHVGLLAAYRAHSNDGVPLADARRILDASIELERRLEPWCPGDCTDGVSFVAEYRRGREHLVFVGTHHAFDPQHPTMRAVADGFNRFRPRIVILEAFPTIMGINPAPLVEQARHYGAPSGNEFLRSEFAYAMSLALARKIPFVGAELTRGEEQAALRTHGFGGQEIAFGAMLGAYSQGFRARNLRDLSLASIQGYYPSVAEVMRLPLDQGGQAMEPLTLDAFLAQYRATYAVDMVGDPALGGRTDPVLDSTRMGDRTHVLMKLRDRHLLGLIEQQLARSHDVLVVFGGSHWATLSVALGERLGSPQVKPFLR